MILKNLLKQILISPIFGLTGLNPVFSLADNDDGGGGDDSDDSDYDDDSGSDNKDIDLSSIPKEVKAALRKDYIGRYRKELEKKGVLIDPNKQAALSRDELKELKEAKKKVDEITHQQRLEQGEYKELLDQREKELNAKIKEIEQNYIQELSARDKALQEKEKLLSTEKQARLNYKIQTDAMNILSKLNAKETDVAYQLVKSNLKFNNNDENKQIVAIDSEGKPLVNEETGKPLTLEEYLVDFANKKPYLFDTTKPVSPGVSKGIGKIGELKPGDVANMSPDEYKEFKKQIGLF